jgi:predicted RNase H-like HicB family nuclease
MKCIVTVHENGDPGGVRYWATVENLDGCNLAEETLEELVKNGPEVIATFVEVCNERGASIPSPTEFEFRILVPA